MFRNKNTPADIVKMQLSDISRVLIILKETGLESWKYEDFKFEIEYHNPLLLVVKINSIVIGFCVARLIIPPGQQNENYFAKSSNVYFPKLKTSGNCGEKFIPECEIYNIAIEQEFQNRGVGSKLLSQIILVASRANTGSIWLEVRSSNRQAISFYEKNSFHKMYERKNFYSKPLESAIVMKMNL